jgi:PKD repeat protein
MKKNILEKRNGFCSKIKIVVLTFLISFSIFQTKAQIANIAPSATANAFGAGQVGWQWTQINDNIYGTCGTQLAFVWTAAPPNGTEYMDWVWPSTKTIGKVVIFHAQTTGRFLTGGTIQRWNGSAWVNHHTFSGLNQANCDNEIIFPTLMTSTRLRITNLTLTGTGQNSNPNFREIEIWEYAGGGGGPVLPPIANFFPSQPTVSSVPTDTVWINSPYELVSTSTNATRSYWDLPGVNPLLPGYVRGAVDWTAQQYIDTAKYNQKFRYTYNTRGFWPVRLLAINSLKRDSLRDSIVRFIWVDTPSTTPKPNFFAARQKIGFGEYASMVDITSGGPNQWSWTFNPPCNLCTTPPYFNNFFAGPTDQNPLFFGGDPGKFTICLQAWNVRGWDTICKKDYMEVLNSISICSGSGSTVSTEKEGFMFAASGPGLSYTRSQVAGCPGFLLTPCADSIILRVDRIKMLPTDTLVIHNGVNASAPILARLGGANINVLPPAILQNGVRGGNRLFVRFMVGTGAIPGGYDSAGFSIRWEIKAASYPKPTASMILQDTIFSLQPVTYMSNSSGTLMQYSWDTDGNGVYDSSGATATRNFLITTPNFRKICLVAYNCVGSDTVCKNILFLPSTQKPTTRFDVDKVQGFNTDTFKFADKSLFGPVTWRWSFVPGTAQFMNGTTSGSKNPMIRFTQRTKYTVKLVVTNQYGSDSSTKIDYINIGAYDQPQCLSDINLADGSIGISRVRLQTGIDTATNAYTPCYQLVGGNQAATMYRGQKRALTIIRPSTTSPMDRKAWIDFNMDGLFSNDELVMNELNAATLQKVDTVTVSSTQPLGSTRMRVGVTYAATQLNPSVTFLGVFRDYVVNFPMDNERPTINLLGGTPFYTEINKPFVDPGVIANDNIEGVISSKYITIGSVDITKVGPNYLRYIVRDNYGNVSDTLNRTVFVILNQTGPSITITPPQLVYVEVYNKYVEKGYSALSNQGVSLNSQVVVTTNLDTAKIGLYSITYTITDAFGLSATAQRAVTVGDSTRPIVTPKFVPATNTFYTHQVGTAIDLTKVVDVTDNYWSRNFIDLTIQGTVDVNNVGSYFISYVARDNSGNLSELVLVEVRVRDTRAPSVILNGVTPMTWEVKTSFVDPGATATDNYWPAATIVITRRGFVNVNALGEYTLWYIATDPSGNKDSVMRIVKIVDTTKPRVNLNGINDVNLPRWKVYVDAPVLLEDNLDTDSAMRQFLVITNSLPKNAQGQHFGDAPGLYSARYKVRDLSGNESDEAKRNINVLPEPNPSGVGDVMNIDRLMSVYPNPSNGLVNMRLADAQQEDVKVVVLDMLGKEMLHKTIKANDLQVQELDLSKQPKGIYFLRVQTGDQVYMKKIQIN